MPFGRKFSHPRFQVAKAFGVEIGLRMPWLRFLLSQQPMNLAEFQRLTRFCFLRPCLELLKGQREATVHDLFGRSAVNGRPNILHGYHDAG